MKPARGFTLVELLIAVTIMLVAVAVAAAVIMTGVNLSRNATQRGDEADWSRLALGEIVHALENAGNGVPGGYYVALNGTTTASPIGPVFGLDGTTGFGGSTATLACPDPASTTPINAPTDDLWVLVPSPGAMHQGCSDPGGAVEVLSQGGGPLRVNWECTAAGLQTSFPDGQTFLVTNMLTGALLTGNASSYASGATGTPATLTFLEQGATPTISDSPSKGGFQKGDLVYGASLVHYFIKTDASGVPGLYRTTALMSGTPISAYPFGETTPTLVQNWVDDLQVAYGFDTAGNGDLTSYVWQNGLSPTSCTSPNFKTLRAVRVSVEVRSSDSLLTNTNATVRSNDTRHMIVENNYTVSTQPAADGFRRVVYTRTVSLPNTSPGSL